jgi:hypothetical protein
MRSGASSKAWGATMPSPRKERHVELIDGSGYTVERAQRGRPRIDKAGKDVALAVRAHQVEADCGYRRAVSAIAAERGLSVRHVLRVVAAFRKALAEEVQMQIMDDWIGEDIEERQIDYEAYLQSCQPDLWDYLQHEVRSPLERLGAEMRWGRPWSEELHKEFQAAWKLDAAARAKRPDVRSLIERPSAEMRQAPSPWEEVRKEIEALLKLNPARILKPSSTKG